MQASPVQQTKRARYSKTDPRIDMSPATLSPERETSDSEFEYLLVSKARNERFSTRGAKPRRYSIEVIISIPVEDEECPLTLDSISESKLFFMPDTPFLKDRPKHTKLTLPCKHSFSVMTLLYSFCKNSMICPCCRAGEDIQADTCCLPPNLRAQFKSKIQETLEIERRHDESSAYQDVLNSFHLFGVTIPYEVLGSNGNLSLVANFYDIGLQTELNTARPIFSFSNILEPRRNNGRMTLAPRGPLRALTHVAHMGVNSIQLSMVLSMQGTGEVLIDSTPTIRLPNINDHNAPMRMTIPGSSNSAMTHNGQFQVLVQLQRNDDNNPITSFEVLFSRTNAFLVLENITWSPGMDNLEIISNSMSMAAVL